MIKRNSPPTYELVGKLLKLPATFWSVDWAKDNYKSDWKSAWVGVKIDKWVSPEGKRKKSWKFLWLDGEDYFLPLKNGKDNEDVQQYVDIGLFSGMLIYIYF